jgi:5-methylcytosine-specific restriction endonuclease McrA
MSSKSTWIRKDKRLAIYMRDGMKCVYCGKFFDRNLLTLDHIKPRDKGGTNDSRNLITSCWSCNSKKQNKRIDFFVKQITKNFIEYKEKMRHIKKLKNRSIEKLRKKAKRILKNG